MIWLNPKSKIVSCDFENFLNDCVVGSAFTGICPLLKLYIPLPNSKAAVECMCSNNSPFTDKNASLSWRRKLIHSIENSFQKVTEYGGYYKRQEKAVLQHNQI